MGRRRGTEGGDLSFAQNASSSSSRNRLAFVLLCPAPNISPPLLLPRKKTTFCTWALVDLDHSVGSSAVYSPGRLTVPPPISRSTQHNKLSDEDSSTTAPKKDASLFFIFVQLFGRHHAPRKFIHYFWVPGCRRAVCSPHLLVAIVAQKKEESYAEKKQSAEEDFICYRPPVVKCLLSTSWRLQLTLSRTEKTCAVDKNKIQLQQILRSIQEKQQLER